MAVTAFGVYCALIAITFILNMVVKAGVMNIFLPLVVAALFGIIKPARLYMVNKEEAEAAENPAADMKKSLFKK